MAVNRQTVRKKIGFQQVLLQDSSVFSIQWIVIPQSYYGTVTSDYLLERYLRYIRLFTLSLIRPYMENGQVEFRLIGSRISLISFTGPRPDSAANSEKMTLSISGGFLVQRENCQRGELAFITKNIRNGLKIILQLSDFCPMLLGNDRPSRVRKILYRLTQAYLHKIVTVNFLARTYKELEGVHPDIKVVKVKVRKGEDT